MDYIKSYSLNIIFLVLSLLYVFFVSPCTSTFDNFFEQNLNNTYFSLFRFVSSSFIVIVGQFICNLIKRVKQKSTFYIDFSIAFWVIVVVHFIFYLLTDFGSFNFANFDISDVVSNAKRLEYAHWQHFYTVIYYVFAYNIFPFQSGVVLFQFLIYSFVSAYIYSGVCSIYNINKYKWILIIPFILPQFIRMNLLSLRSCLYYVFVLLLFSFLYFKNKEKKQINLVEYIIVLILSVLVTIWRSENIILLFLIPLMFIPMININISKIKFVVFLILFYSLCFWQYSLQEFNFRGNEYSLCAVKRPLASIIRTNFKSNNKENDIKVINNVLNVQKLVEYDNSMAVHMGEYYNLDNDSIKNLYLTTIKLIVLNPIPYLEDRIIFSKFLTYTTILRDGFTDISSLRIYKESNNQIHQKERTLNFLEGLNKNYESTIWRTIMYQLLFPAIVILIAFICAFIRRNLMLTIIIFTSISMNIISYLSAAEPFFHYFLQGTLLSYFILAFYIVYLLTNLKKEYNKNLIS